MRRENFTPTKYSLICSKHFHEEDIDRTSQSVVRIRNGAVPCIFEAFPKHLQENIPPKRKAPMNHVVKDNSSNSLVSVDVPPLQVSPNVPTEVESLKSENETLKRKLDDSETELIASKKKIKVLQQTKRRQAKRNADLKSVLSELEKKRFISEDSINLLENCAGGVSDLLLRQVAKHSNKPVPNSYSHELRSFALTLNFYSPHAYRYVRKKFETCLPHPRTIQKWYQSVDGSPGFSKPAFSALKLRSEVATKSGKPLLCALVMDEIAIRKHVEWDGKRCYGYIDMGTELDNDTDSLPVAREALTFMIVSVNDSWKLPVGYFLTAGLGAREKGNLVEQCLTMLHSVGVTVISLTCDGASTNLSMIKNLGCTFEFDTVESAFPHPVTKKPVCIFLDPCHMLKLVRNCFGDKKTLIDKDGNFVKWK